MRRSFLHIAVIVAVGACCAPVRARQVGQTGQGGLLPTPPLARPVAGAPRPVAASARSATRTVRAVVVFVDMAAHTLQLREEGAGGSDTAGRTFTVFADPGARYRRNNGEVGGGLSDFRTGDGVAARVTFRAAAASAGDKTEEIGLLRALWDTKSYEAENRARREICAGTVTSWGRLGDTLTVCRAVDGEAVAFHVTAKSVIYRGGVATLPSAYPVGATIAVKPRALPSGALMAAIVAETERDALALYGDGLRTWAGEVAALDEQAGTLTLRRDDGAVRTVSLVSLGVIKRGRAQVLPPRAVVGLNVRVHLQKETERNGLRVADAVTVPTRTVKKTAPGGDPESAKR